MVIYEELSILYNELYSLSNALVTFIPPSGALQLLFTAE